MNKANLIPLFNMFLRGFGLSTRFALSVFMARYLDLEAIGIFGIVSGLVATTPAIIGLGINYFLNREIVGEPTVGSLAKVRDRLIFTLASLTIAVIFSIIFILIIRITWMAYLPIIVLLIFSECLSFDISLSLISLKKTVLANVILFSRTALWVPVYAGVSTFYPSFRTIDYVLTFWVSGSLLSFFILFWSIRQWPLRSVIKIPIDVKWIFSTIRSARLIYIGDLGVAGMSYLDRFIIAAIIGLHLTGVYTFFWSFANAVQILITVAFVQPSLPRLVEAFDQFGEGAWRRVMAETFIKSLLVCVSISAALYGLIFFLLPLVTSNSMEQYIPVFGIMLLATAVRIISDIANYGLYSRRMDKVLSVLNICGLIASIGATYAFVYAFGLFGAAISMVLTPLILLVARLHAISRDSRSRRIN